MDPVAGEFNFTRLEKVAFGPGKAASLGQELARRRLNRALIVTGKTLGHSKLLDKVTAAAGSIQRREPARALAYGCRSGRGVPARGRRLHGEFRRREPDRYCESCR